MYEVVTAVIFLSRILSLCKTISLSSKQNIVVVQGMMYLKCETAVVSAFKSLSVEMVWEIEHTYCCSFFFQEGNAFFFFFFISVMLYKLKWFASTFAAFLQYEMRKTHACNLVNINFFFWCVK